MMQLWTSFYNDTWSNYMIYLQNNQWVFYHCIHIRYEQIKTLYSLLTLLSSIAKNTY